VIDPSAVVKKALMLHPRVAYQGLQRDEAARERIAAALPPFVPFRGEYHSMLAILDWDHRLPSRGLVLRINGFYSADAAAAGRASMDQRLAEIDSRDRFPEFDVPDFEGLIADEAYEAAVTLDGVVSEWRFTSTWRRDVTPQDGKVAVETARRSDAFKLVRSEAVGRPPHLGDLEAVGWCPPCESQHPRWTMDVWYLTSFDGQVGKGRSLLVDTGERRVVAVRDFAIRAG
jgi:hypothetical protein